MPTTTTDSPFPERTEAVRTLADDLGWTAIAVQLTSLDARGDTFVTGHLVDVLDHGRPRQHTVYLEAELDSGDAGYCVESSGGERLTAWLYPADPALPALPAAVSAESAAELVSRLGLDTEGLTTEVLSYRPGKRAVIRATTSAGTVYVKVVAPQRVAGLRERHAQWREHGIPVPIVQSWREDGMLVLEPLKGAELISMLDRLPGDDGLVTAVGALSDRIAEVPSTHAARASLTHRLDWYRSRLAQLSPEDVSRTHAVCDLVTRMLGAVPSAPRAVTIHGDLHLAQLFAQREDPLTITGVLDIDTAGLGDPADDAAALVAHLLASADLTERSVGIPAARRARGLAHTFAESWEDDPDPALATRARAIAATHLLGHGLSGSLTAGRSLELAESMLRT